MMVDTEDGMDGEDTEDGQDTPLTAEEVWFQFDLYLHTALQLYMDIYISQKIRLCKRDLEGQFKNSLQAKVFNFFT